VYLPVHQSSCYHVSHRLVNAKRTVVAYTACCSLSACCSSIIWRRRSSMRVAGEAYCDVEGATSSL